MIRKFRGDTLRRKADNKGLRDAWERHQRAKYGDMYHKICKSRGDNRNGL